MPIIAYLYNHLIIDYVLEQHELESSLERVGYLSDFESKKLILANQ